MVITMAKLRMAHASTHGARKPPGPIFKDSHIYVILKLFADQIESQRLINCNHQKLFVCVSLCYIKFSKMQFDSHFNKMLF